MKRKKRKKRKQVQEQVQEQVNICVRLNSRNIFFMVGCKNKNVRT